MPVYPARFISSAAGEVVQIGAGCYAFVPAPLRTEVDFSRSIYKVNSLADAALSELAGMGYRLPNPHLLMGPYIRREAVLSSRIEGTRASLSDVLLDEVAGPASPSRQSDVLKVRNYVETLEYGIARLETLPLSKRLVLELQARLMRGVRGERKLPGEFRRSQVWIGGESTNIEAARYVPPPPSRLDDLLNDWEQFLHYRGDIPDLIQCALMHEQFEAIHPFLDGNGRLGRVLITLFLMERGRLKQPLLYLSAFFEANRLEYYGSLQRVRTEGDWNGWLRFFLRGVVETAEASRQQVRELIDLRENLREELRALPRAQGLLDALFVNPYVTIRRAPEILSVANPTAQRVVRQLEARKILREVTSRRWGRRYRADPIWKVVGMDQADGQESTESRP